MAGVLDVPKSRINSAMLSQHVNRAVCFVGRVEQVHPSGKSFSVSDGEGKSATVELSEPLQEELSGVVEVVGMVTPRGAIMASTYCVLREERGVAFDLQLYNQALQVLQDFPQLYPFQLAASG